jgi:hypothetical protein
MAGNEARRVIPCGLFQPKSPAKEGLKMSGKKKDVPLIPINEVAELLQTTPLNVLMHIKRGKLVGSEEEGTWSVDSQSLADFRAVRDGADKTLCRSGCSKAGGCASCG